ncbi:glycosyltransferase family 2 protein, partial [Methylosinus sp. Sm6]|uniref:glycosyltransferase family 2 protein n=1 Tax=Methylosinus sp. Sm6 TaxID=2866948 RepID=UPI001C992BD2
MTLRMPIAIMSFDRPQYLQAVLQSLARQHWPATLEPQFFLFQDSAKSGRTGAALGDEDAAAASVRVFQRYFPDGVVVQAEHNLGVARNFDRAERVFFEDLRAEAAVFLEDDMVLSRYYFAAMAELAEIALRRPEIGMFSAYGLHHFTE